MSVSSSSRGRRGLPRGPHGLTPSEVARSQRERLLAAMTDAVAELGYTATPVSEVIERAGVSRKTFYVHFRDRRDCLVAAYEQAAARMLDRLNAAADRAQGERRLAAIVAELCALAAEDPAACRLQVAEVAAGGQALLLSREQMILALGALLRSSLEPIASAPASSVMGMIAGGLLRVIEHRARTGQLEDPRELARELTRWVQSYQPAPATLASGDGQPPALVTALPAMQTLLGGRAPGTLSMTSRRLADLGRGASPSFTAHSQRERILDAVTNACATKGYVGLTVDEVVALASVSLNTFYEHFKDKEDAFLVAQELGHVRSMAILDQAIVSASSWDAGVRVGITALLGFFFSEPAFARLAAIEAPIATRQTAARAQIHLASYADVLLDGAPRARKPPPVAKEAVSASLHAAVFAFAVHGVIQDPARAHSYASYLALAPFLGPNKVFADRTRGATCT